MIFVLLAGAWLAFGARTFVCVDDMEMRKHVPYGESPSVFSLRQIRVMMFCIIVVCAPIWWVRWWVAEYRYQLRVLSRHRRRRRARRSPRLLTEQDIVDRTAAKARRKS